MYTMQKTWFLHACRNQILFCFSKYLRSNKFFKNLWVPIFKLNHRIFISKKSGTLQCLFGLKFIKNLINFVRKSWPSVTVNIPAKKNMKQA